MKKLYFLSLTILMSFYSFGQATDLIISEYAEGTIGNSKYVEIFNGTGADVDLAGYRIWTIANGGTWPEGTINLTGTLANNATFVIANNETNVPGANLYNTNCNWNGDDAVGLAKDIATVWTLIDAVGIDGADPGTGWDVAGVTNATANNKLIRKASICSPNSNWATSAGTDASSSEWEVAAYTTGAAENGHTNSCTTDPNLIITSPINATIFNPNTTNVNIALSISNFVVGNPGTGIDGHIHYTINGGSVVMKYDTTPIAVPVTAGTTYTIAIQLVDNSHQPLSPAVGATVTFTVDSFVTVADLAALRAHVAANGAGKYYQVSSSPIVTYTRATRNQKYVQDTSGGILIDDNVTAPGVITTSLTAGDAISGLKGQSVLFSGLLQITPLANVTISSTGNTTTPQVVTIAQLNSAVTAATYESELVQINGVTFDTTTANFPLSTDAAANINLTIGSDVLTFRTAFSEANYMGTAKPTSATNIIALVGRFNTTAQVTSRNLTDLNAPLSSNSFDNINGLTVYPNPLSGNTLFLTSTANAAMSIEIYDLLGKEVLKANVTNNALNVSKLTAGVYVVKITEEGKTATRKLVIQ
jgi:hypothetical protein